MGFAPHTRVLVDFNAIQNLDEKTGRKRFMTTTRKFNKVIFDLNSIDLVLEEAKFTWSHFGHRVNAPNWIDFCLQVNGPTCIRK